MTNSIVPIKFIVGSRQVLAVPRTLQTVSFGLDELLRGEHTLLPEIDQRTDGLRILSAPTAAVPDIMEKHPDYLIGGFQSYPRYYIDMAEKDYDSYLAKFSSKTRSTFNRKRRKLAEFAQGSLQVQSFSTESDVDAFLTDALPLSRRTYQGRLLGAGLPEDEAAASQMKALAREDHFRAFLLSLQGKIVSYLYVPTADGIISYAYLGYDPDFAHLSVGTVLQMEALERLFSERRYRYFDFTEGTGAHKEMFGTHSVEAATFFMLRPTTYNRLLINSLNTFDNSVAAIKELAQKGGVLGRARRALRV